jgi:hypothetical protein
MKKTLTFVAAGFAVLILSWVVLIGAVYAWGGVMTVQVQDRNEGVNLYLPLPIAMVDAALVTGGLMLPDERLLELDVDLGQWEPMLRSVIEALDDCPDFTLVEVQDGSEHVKVYKEHGVLKVEVDQDDVRIRVAVPTRAVERNAKRLARWI